ncbi:hypothetical protein [Cytobacillus sp. Bac17]|uniref:hypothetical protein n=1 Tax=Cytobacillus sp. Bac17 TaxID=2926008 RepID=UPI002117663D|nr:hypothetical protein [Cytobacillus sp. Bac17]
MFRLRAGFLWLCKLFQLVRALRLGLSGFLLFARGDVSFACGISLVVQAFSAGARGDVSFARGNSLVVRGFSAITRNTIPSNAQKTGKFSCRLSL